MRKSHCYRISNLYADLSSYGVRQLFIAGHLGCTEVPLELLDDILGDGFTQPLCRTSWENTSPWLLEVPHEAIGILTRNDQGRLQRGVRGWVHLAPKRAGVMSSIRRRLDKVAIVLAMLSTLLAGCGSSRPSTVNLDDHAGVFLASDPARQEYAVIRLNPAPPTSYVTGYVYATADEAQAEAAAGLPWGDAVLGQPLQVIRGNVTYTDPHGRKHVNRLAVVIQYSADAEGKTWTTPTETEEGYFDRDGLLRVVPIVNRPLVWSPWPPESK